MRRNLDVQPVTPAGWEKWWEENRRRSSRFSVPHREVHAATSISGVIGAVLASVDGRARKAAVTRTSPRRRVREWRGAKIESACSDQKIKIRFRDAAGPQLRLQAAEVSDRAQGERCDLDRRELTFYAASIGLSPGRTLDAIHQLGYHDDARDNASDT